MTDNNEIEDVNWDEELENLNEELDPRAARFHIAIRQIEQLMTEWGETPIYAEPPEDLMVGQMALSEEPRDGYMETSLGDISAIPLLGVMARIFGEMMSAEDGPDMQTLIESRAKIIDVVKDLMIEGILISNAPEWKERFIKAAEGLN